MKNLKPTKNTLLPLERAIQIAGTQLALETKSGVKQQNLSYWLVHKNGVVSAEAVKPICQAVGYEVKPHELRPDLFDDSTAVAA